MAAGGVGRLGGSRLRGRAVGPVGLLEELDAPAGGEPDLGGEPVGVLPVLAPAPRLQHAGDVDEPSLRGVLLEHLDQPGLEGDDPVPLGLVDALAGVPVEVALVGGDGHVGHAAAAGEVVDDDIGAQASDDFRTIQTKHNNYSCGT